MAEFIERKQAGLPRTPLPERAAVGDGRDVNATSVIYLVKEVLRAQARVEGVEQGRYGERLKQKVLKRVRGGGSSSSPTRTARFVFRLEDTGTGRIFEAASTTLRDAKALELSAAVMGGRRLSPRSCLRIGVRVHAVLRSLAGECRRRRGGRRGGHAFRRGGWRRGRCDAQPRGARGGLGQRCAVGRGAEGSAARNHQAAERGALSRVSRKFRKWAEPLEEKIYKEP